MELFQTHYLRWIANCDVVKPKVVAAEHISQVSNYGFFSHLFTIWVNAYVIYWYFSSTRKHTLRL
ncbi:hypothetical protein HanIR_Chr10g0483421 [Helianthus annuus]|nr:hypothetical protein HanIR_Chr10g0483421 [Helianthus annuus]